MARKAPPKRVMGITAPPPRVTWAGYKAIVLYIIAPFLGGLLALDIAGFLVAKYIFGSCYGVLCMM